MEAYEKLTDSIVDRIMCSQAKSLEESKKILMNVKNRKLYVCLGHALSGEKMVRRFKKKNNKSITFYQAHGVNKYKLIL